MKPLLCQPIDYPTLFKLLQNDQWVFQQKLDGDRLLVDIEDGKVTGYSRKGERTNVPRAVQSALSYAFSEDHYVLDGELMGPMFNVFDLPIAGTLVQPSSPYSRRLEALKQLGKLGVWWGPVAMLKTAEGVDAKAELVRQAIEKKAEGIIARKLTGRYQPGKRMTDVVKCKFWKAIDCVVRENPTDKENWDLEVLDGDKWVLVSGVSALTGDGPRLRPGNVVEVKYLYASKDRKLVQPVSPRLRTDKNPQECTIDQIVYTNKEVL